MADMTLIRPVNNAIHFGTNRYLIHDVNVTFALGRTV